MLYVLLISTHLLAFMYGMQFGGWSARENHATAEAFGRWLRSWFM